MFKWFQETQSLCLYLKFLKFLKNIILLCKKFVRFITSMFGGCFSNKLVPVLAKYVSFKYIFLSISFSTFFPFCSLTKNHFLQQGFYQSGARTFDIDLLDDIYVLVL